ncbi:MAG TPA: DegT/DnrJ/EryC1/StrS family aminotransferase [Paludibaculum sp.]|jgi:dTDP-4-amino-4,6-dideoxygalactose transaminase
MIPDLTRRHFIVAAPAAGAALAPGKPALLGGGKVRAEAFPAWPVFDQREEQALVAVLRSGKWYRGSGSHVKNFEAAYSTLTGAKQCLATANGTSALLISLNVLDVQAGDEVLLPPYTFTATVNVVLRQHALPVFVDTDPRTFQMDATKVEPLINENTRVLMPVHLGGNVCDLDALLAIARRRRIPLIEDACQSHLAEWKGRKVGTYGDTGCFSFQASKNLNSGEGGAILFNDEDLRERAYAFHNNGSGLRAIGANFAYASSGANLRLTEFQAAILLAQMTRLDHQIRTRTDNAKYLTTLLKESPGLEPAAMYSGCTNNAYHLFMARYDPQAFAGLPRDKFLKALSAEGIPCSGGYSPLNTQPFIRNTIRSRGYKRCFSEKRLQQWEEQNRCPANDKLCTEAVWFTQNMLIGPRSDMDQIAEAVRKIRTHAADLVRA